MQVNFEEMISELQNKLQTQTQVPESSSQLIDLYANFLVNLAKVKTLTTDKYLCGLFHNYNKKYQVILGSKVDEDTNICNSEGITHLRNYVMKQCKSAKEYTNMFISTDEIPTEFAQEIPFLINYITKMEQKYELEAKNSTTITKKVLDSTKTMGTSS